MKIQGDTTQMEPVAKTALKMLGGDIREVLGSQMKINASSIGKESSKESSDKNIIKLSKDAAAFAYKKEAFQIKAENGNIYIKGSMEMAWKERHGRNGMEGVGRYGWNG